MEPPRATEPTVRTAEGGTQISLAQDSDNIDEAPEGKGGVRGAPRVTVAEKEKEGGRREK